jgi:hypothetical protein
MQKRSRKPTSDVNQAAFEMVTRSTGESSTRNRKPTKAEISRFMAEMGSRGGRKGGKNRWSKVSAEERSAALSKAAKARWGKQKGKDESGDRGGI